MFPIKIIKNLKSWQKLFLFYISLSGATPTESKIKKIEHICCNRHLNFVHLFYRYIKKKQKT